MGVAQMMCVRGQTITLALTERLISTSPEPRACDFLLGAVSRRRVLYPPRNARVEFALAPCQSRFSANLLVRTPLAVEAYSSLGFCDNDRSAHRPSCSFPV